MQHYFFLILHDCEAFITSDTLSEQRDFIISTEFRQLFLMLCISLIAQEQVKMQPKVHSSRDFSVLSILQA